MGTADHLMNAALAIELVIRLVSRHENILQGVLQIFSAVILCMCLKPQAQGEHN